MEYNVIYDEKNNCLIGRCIGNMDHDNIINYVEEISKMAKEHNCKRFINDLREANIDLSIGQLYFTPQTVDKENFDKSWKRAIIVNEENNIHSFYENTAKNKGLDAKIFNNIEDALDWL